MSDTDDHPLLVWSDLPAARSGPRKGAANSTPCVIVGCPRSQAGRGLCSLHHHRLMDAIPLVADHEEVGLRPSGLGVWGIVLRDEDGVLCYECGHWLRQLATHLVRIHGITGDEYRQRHGLPAGVGLESLGARAKRQANSVRRMGSDSWRRFAERRDETLPESQRRAARAARRENLVAGAAAIHSDTLRAARAGRRTKKCRWCGGPMPADPESRHLRVCSTECSRAANRAAAWRRSAGRAGEPLDFERGTGTGARLTAEQIDAELGIAPRSWVTGVNRGRYPAHDGRAAGEPWWWESTVTAARTRKGTQ